MRVSRPAICHRTLGTCLAPLAAVTVPTLLVAAWAGEAAAALGLAVPLLGGLAGGLGARRVARVTEAPLAPTLALAWLIAVLLGAFPFLAAAHLGAAPSETTRAFADPVNALFESMSGLTSTGLTVTADPRELPASLLWWRSTTQWLGAVGILSFGLAAAASAGAGGGDGDADAADEELGSGEDRRRGASLRRLLRRTWAAYATLTLLAAAGLFLTGMDAWDAVNHVQTAAATGGFSTSPDSLAAWDTPVHAVALAVMAAGALSFGTLRAMTFGRRPRALLLDPQARWLTAACVAVAAAVLLGGGLTGWPAVFDACSAVTTTGFSVAGDAEPTGLTAAALIAAMLIGASAGSTAGGFKLARLRRLARHALGRGDGGHRLSEPLSRTLWIAAAFAATYAAGVAALWLLGGRPPLGDAAFEAASALGTVGLSTGLSSPELPAGGRLVLVALMWLGRLEVLAALSLLPALTGGLRPRF